jgi:hypothetical protein
LPALPHAVVGETFRWLSRWHHAQMFIFMSGMSCAVALNARRKYVVAEINARTRQAEYQRHIE